MTDNTPPPPPRLSSKMGHRDFHPCYSRVGIRFDEQERSDVREYDITHEPHMLITVRGEVLYGVVEPYWRYAESRQQRRARERWEAKHRPAAGGQNG